MSDKESRYVMIYFEYCNQYDIIELPMAVAKTYRKGAGICIEYSKEEGGWATGKILQIGTKDQVENGVLSSLTNEAARKKYLQKAAGSFVELAE
ncbi:unnamed protein product [Auanema sp. JU1783]|nr:unnamed protein product [Auanema sp. JU1783]